MRRRYLPIYLDDHLAAATLAVALARRMLRERPGDTLLEWLLPQLEEDRRVLRGRIARPSRLKPALARVAERLGRLKLNGHLTTYSPLSRLQELETLAALLGHERRLWLALGEDELAERARVRVERVEAACLDAARNALG